MTKILQERPRARIKLDVSIICAASIPLDGPLQMQLMAYLIKLHTPINSYALSRWVHGQPPSWNGWKNHPHTTGWKNAYIKWLNTLFHYLPMIFKYAANECQCTLNFKSAIVSTEWITHRKKHRSIEMLNIKSGTAHWKKRHGQNRKYSESVCW